MATKTSVIDEAPSDGAAPKTPAKRRRGPSTRSPQIEKYLDSKGVKWEFHENVSPGSFDLQKSLRNQARLTKLIPSQVETYIDAMKRGDVFPPVIAHRSEDSGKLITIDGNHRLDSSRQLDRPMDVYVVIEADPKMITLMTFEANTKHGVPTNQQERVIHALWLIDTGASRTDAAAAVGAPLAAVTKEWNRKQAERRADEVGIPRSQWDNINQSIRTRLLNLATDEVFKAAAELAYKANLTVNEALDMVTQLNETRSVTRQLAYVKNLSEGTYADRISSGAALFGTKQGGNTRQTPKTRANSSIGMVLHMPEDVVGLASTYSPQERDAAAKKAKEAAEKLTLFANALTSLNEQAEA